MILRLLLLLLVEPLRASLRGSTQPVVVMMRQLQQLGPNNVNTSTNSVIRKTLGNHRLVDEKGGQSLSLSNNNDLCGLDAAIDGTMAVVGCPGTDRGVGAVQIFEQQPNGEWKLIDTIRPTTVNVLGLFGTNVAVRNNVIVVGAYTNSDTASGDGSAFVYEKNTGGGWIETVLKIENPMQGDQFGRDVTISEDGSTVAIGAALADGGNVEDSGTVSIFRKRNGQWTLQATIVPDRPETLSSFGSALGLSGRTLVVGAFGRTVNGQEGRGIAFVFDEARDGTWKQSAVLLADDGSPNDAFGNAVDIDKNRIVVGALNKDDGNITNAGAVYIYDRRRPSGTWVQVAKLMQSDSSPLDRFGQSVAVVGDEIAVGTAGSSGFQNSAGAVFLYERQADGSYVSVSMLGTDQNQLVGISVGFSNTDLIVGAPGGVRGSAYIEARTTLGTCLPQVTGFKVRNLLDQSESPILFPINVHSLGGVINIYAEVEDCGQVMPFQCMKLEWGSKSRLERTAPYTMYSSNGGSPTGGFEVLRACLYDDFGCKVGPRGCLEVDTFVLDCAPAITSFVLYDATTDKPLATISNGRDYCLPPGGMINIQAIANCVEFVEFSLRGAAGRSDDRIESTAPYFLYGDIGTDIRPQYDKVPMATGIYALRARYRPGNSLLGRGVTLTQWFRLLNCTAAPSAVPSVWPTTSPSVVNSILQTLPTNETSSATQGTVSSSPARSTIPTTSATTSAPSRSPPGTSVQKTGFPASIVGAPGSIQPPKKDRNF